MICTFAYSFSRSPLPLTVGFWGKFEQYVESNAAQLTSELSLNGLGNLALAFIHLDKIDSDLWSTLILKGASQRLAQLNQRNFVFSSEPLLLVLSQL